MEMVTTHWGVYFLPWLIHRFIPQCAVRGSPGSCVVPVGITNRWQAVLERLHASLSLSLKLVEQWQPVSCRSSPNHSPLIDS